MNITLVSACGGMVDAADLKANNTEKYPKKSNEINVLPLLTFSWYTYTCLTHFFACKTKQIGCFLGKKVCKS